MNKKILIAVCVVAIVLVISVVAIYLSSPIVSEPKPSGQPVSGQFSVVSPDAVTVKVNETKDVTITLTSHGYEGDATARMFSYPILDGTGLYLSMPVFHDVALESDSVVSVNFTFTFEEVGVTQLPFTMTFDMPWYGNWRQDNQFMVYDSLTVEIEE